MNPLIPPAFQSTPSKKFEKNRASILTNRAKPGRKRLKFVNKLSYTLHNYKTVWGWGENHDVLVRLDQQLFC